jgi:hypothetical protein
VHSPIHLRIQSFLCHHKQVRCVLAQPAIPLGIPFKALYQRNNLVLLIEGREPSSQNGLSLFNIHRITGSIGIIGREGIIGMTGIIGNEGITGTIGAATGGVRGTGGV